MSFFSIKTDPYSKIHGPGSHSDCFEASASQKKTEKALAAVSTFEPIYGPDSEALEDKVSSVVKKQTHAKRPLAAIPVEPKRWSWKGVKETGEAVLEGILSFFACCFVCR